MEKIEHPYIRKSAFAGVLDKNLKKLEKRLGVSLSLRGDSLMLDGPQDRMDFAKQYFELIKNLEEKGNSIKEEDFHIALDLLEEGQGYRTENFFPSKHLNLSRKTVTPKSLNQPDNI